VLHSWYFSNYLFNFFLECFRRFRANERFIIIGCGISAHRRRRSRAPAEIEPGRFAKLPRRTVQAKDHDRPEATFEGVPLMEILQMAGVKFGEKLRGQALANYLLVEASDGYKVSFALAELDSAFTDQIVLLADRQDNKPLSENEGPLRIIVPHEKRHGRWVRQVTSLIIRRP
jgi:hypothetical protein